MRGCGRQKIGATINLITYWVFGLPLACALAFWGKLGAVGLWIGLACTASIQALLMTLTVYRWVQKGERGQGDWRKLGSWEVGGIWGEGESVGRVLYVSA
jgi:Na+-driven multidrug efflux pump